MFGSDHYVPVLRWKRGEQRALGLLEPTDKDSLTPLIEIPPDDFLPGNVDTALDTSGLVRRLSTTLELAVGVRNAFVDFGLLVCDEMPIAPVGAMTRFFDLLDGGGVTAVPVTGLARPESYQAATRPLAMQRRALALRLTTQDVARTTLHDEIEALLGSFELAFEEVHLLVDLGVVGENSLEFVYICARIPSLPRWQTFTVLAGSFPRDLRDLSVGTHLLPRFEWRHWRSQVFSEGTVLARVPSFGDYTTQHAKYYVPPPRANVSASLRYTSDDEWLVMRGEGLWSEGSPGYAQYPATAQLLCDRKEYRGPDFSAGDLYLWQIAARHIGTTGSPETWLRAGINHHIVFVLRQLAGAATVGEAA